MTNILPVASGKGGVGKTLFAVNLGVALACVGKTVVLIDLDLGGSNLHTCLGIRNLHRGIGNLIYKQQPNLEALLVETDVKRLHFIPGDSVLPGTANLGYFIKQKIIRSILELRADFILIDLGSGTSYNTLDFFLISSTGIVVTVPETTAILNAYSFLKSTMFRMLYRSFANKSREREIIRDYFSQRMEGTDHTIDGLVDTLAQSSAKAGDTARERIDEFAPRVVVNMGRGQNDKALGARLREIVRRNLNLELGYLGFLEQDDNVRASILQRKPLFLINRTSPFCQAIDRIVHKLLERATADAPDLFELDEDPGMVPG